MNKVIALKIVFAGIAVILLVLEAVAYQRYKPSVDEFSHLTQVEGRIRYSTNGRSSWSSINGHTVCADVGAFGDGFAITEKSGLVNGQNVTLSVAKLRSSLGETWMAVKAESGGHIYFDYSPEQCLALWRARSKEMLTMLTFIILAAYLVAFVIIEGVSK